MQNHQNPASSHINLKQGVGSTSPQQKIDIFNALTELNQRLDTLSGDMYHVYEQVTGYCDDQQANQVAQLPNRSLDGLVFDLYPKVELIEKHLAVTMERLGIATARQFAEK